MALIAQSSVQVWETHADRYFYSRIVSSIIMPSSNANELECTKSLVYMLNQQLQRRPPRVLVASLWLTSSEECTCLTCRVHIIRSAILRISAPLSHSPLVSGTIDDWDRSEVSAFEAALSPLSSLPVPLHPHFLHPSSNNLDFFPLGVKIGLDTSTGRLVIKKSRHETCLCYLASAVHPFGL